MPVANHIGTIIQERRIELGKTQKQLASEAEATEGMISLVESGDRTPSLRLLGKIADALDLDMKLLPRPMETEMAVS